jgi:gelsolin
VDEEIKQDIHFWIGKYSTQDEYGTAAYKTVELDTFHDDKPIQHREVQGHESNKFKSYFEVMT